MPLGAWRHFGERFELAPTPQECGAVPDSYAAVPLPPPAAYSVTADLGCVIEGEILPRLMLAHRDKPRPTRLPVAHRPTPDQIARFSALLLDPREADVTAHVLGLLDEGLSLESLLLELLAPAARHLGELWESDDCDFVDVTMAVGRLQAIARTLCARLEDEAGPSTGRTILLLPCPGETHTFCLAIVASFFREAGWQVTTTGVDAGLNLVDLVQVEWFDVIGFTLSCEVLLPALTEAVRDLRKASCNRGLRVIVGGPHFLRRPDHVHLVGADATAGDGRIAPDVAESLLEKRARAC